MELTPEKLTDGELVKMSLTNSDSFSYLVSRYEKQFFAYIRRLGVWDTEDARDLLQEVFIKVYLNLNDYDGRMKFSSWAYRIAHNETVSLLRTKTYSQKVFLDDEAWEKIGGSSDLFAEVHFEIEGQKLREALNELPSDYKEVIYWRYFEDRDYTDIADILRKPKGTISTLLNRAKKLLKEKLIK